MLAPCWARSRPAGRIRFLWDFAFGGTPLTRPFLAQLRLLGQEGRAFSRGMRHQSVSVYCYMHRKICFSRFGSSRQQGFRPRYQVRMVMPSVGARSLSERKVSLQRNGIHIQYGTCRSLAGQSLKPGRAGRPETTTKRDSKAWKDSSKSASRQQRESV
jgi:hypothetical protein